MPKFVDKQGNEIPPEAWENDYTPRELTSFMSEDQIAELDAATAEKKARVAALIKSRKEVQTP